MLRFRSFMLVCLAALATVGAGAPALASQLAVPGAADSAIALEASAGRATLEDADPFTSKGHLDTAETALQFFAGRSTSHHVVLADRLRIAGSGPAFDHASGAEASRARGAMRASLEFAAALAAARVGKISSPSTGPPFRHF